MLLLALKEMTVYSPPFDLCFSPLIHITIHKSDGKKIAVEAELKKARAEIEALQTSLQLSRDEKTKADVKETATVEELHKARAIITALQQSQEEKMAAEAHQQNKIAEVEEELKKALAQVDDLKKALQDENRTLKVKSILPSLLFHSH
jgi:DNA repair exonuclease SbcCD ATPase subunit